MGFSAYYAADGRVLPPILAPPESDTHKYARGHALIFSGPELATGASRLAAEAALRIGAGLVTIVGEKAALREHAAHVSAIMLREEGEDDPLSDRRTASVLIGPGAGRGGATRNRTLRLLNRGCAALLDADALTSFADEPDALFSALHDQCVLTPHEGEYGRLFPDISLIDRDEAALAASERAGSIVLLKGSRTSIAAPDGRLAYNDHSSPWLATAGSGDTLGGMIAGFLAQGCDPFDAAAMASWLHGEAGLRAGAGLTADDLPLLIPSILADLPEWHGGDNGKVH